MRSIQLFLIIILSSCSTKKETESVQHRHTTRSENATPAILFVIMNVKKMEPMERAMKRASAYYKQSYVVEHAPIPSNALHPKRKRYSGDSLLKYLHTYNNGRYAFAAGLTDVDICTNKNGVEDWGIFGLGSLTNNGCVTSGKRLQTGVSKQQYEDRLTKVILHEIGHNHGVKHCVSPDPCFMKDANGKIITVDKEPVDMCQSCKQIAGIN
jgi:archaemetzincin